MRVVVCSAYGGPEVLRFETRPLPVPTAGEVRVRVRATTVTSGDWRIRTLTLPRGFGLLGRPMLGFARPRRPVLGSELAGDVDAVGAAVTRFRVGDRVFAFPGIAMGAHAEYRCIAQDGPVAPMPQRLSYEEAAALSFAGTTMLDFHRRAELRRGEHVLVVGASGAVGSAAVQLARQAGARVTAVCSGANAAWVRALGAAQVIDYTTEDFVARGGAYDVIVDTTGTAPFTRCAPVLAPRGRLLAVLATLPDMLRAPWQSLTSGRRVIAGPVAERPQDVRHLGDLVQAGAFVPVIDRRFAYDEIRAAHAYVALGHKRGNVVVTVAG